MTVELKDASKVVRGITHIKPTSLVLETGHFNVLLGQQIIHCVRMKMSSTPGFHQHYGLSLHSAGLKKLSALKISTQPMYWSPASILFSSGSRA